MALCLAATPAVVAAETQWPELPATGFIRGRPATVQDAREGSAVFSMNGGGKGPLTSEIPQYAVWTDEHGVKRPAILVQAERAQDGAEMVGLRSLAGSEIVATMPEVTLLGTRKPH
jgi:hypothetical protein